MRTGDELVSHMIRENREKRQRGERRLKMVLVVGSARNWKKLKFWMLCLVECLFVCFMCCL